jgi:hypothetical protein
LGTNVTFDISVAAHRRMTEIPAPDGLSFATFSDGFKPGDDVGHYMSDSMQI